MRVFIYKNGLCDPVNKIGAVKHFSSAEDVDGFLKTLCINMNPIAHRQMRVFIANDEVEQHEVDHHALMGDNYGLDLRRTSIKEVDTLEMAAEVNARMRVVKDAQDRRIQLIRERSAN